MRLISSFIFILLLLLVGGAAHSQSIELPPGFPPLRDDIDVFAPFRIVPTNPFLVKDKNFQPIGITLQPELLSPEYLQLASELKPGMLRLRIEESDFLDPNSANFIKLESIVDSITKQGTDILLVLDTNFVDAGLYSAFFARVFGAVGSKVREYQLLDNINLRTGISLPALSEAISIIRSLRAQRSWDFDIVLGGILGIDQNFINKLNSMHIVDRVDAVAFNLFPTSSGMELSSNAPGIIAPHSIYEAGLLFHNLSSNNKKVYVTSLGVSTALPPFGVSQLEQASMLSRASLYLLNLGASRIFLSSLMDTDPFSLTPAESSGLVMADKTPKVSFSVMKNLCSILKGSYFIVPYYLFQMSNEFPAEGDPTFALHLYNPNEKTIHFIYWLTTVTTFERFTNLIVYRPALEPLSQVNLLTGETASVPFRRGGNLLVFSHLPISHIPTSIKFKAEG